MLPCKELRRAPIFYLGRDALSPGTFFLEQLSLALESPSVTAEITTLANNAVTGNQQCNTIVGARRCHRADGTRRADCLRNFAIRFRLSERNPLQLAPHLPLKCGGLNVEWNIAAHAPTVDRADNGIDPHLQLTRRSRDSSSFSRWVLAGQRLLEMLFVVTKLDRAHASFGRGNEEQAERRFRYGVVDVGAGAPTLVSRGGHPQTRGRILVRTAAGSIPGAEARATHGLTSFQLAL